MIYNLGSIKIHIDNFDKVQKQYTETPKVIDRAVKRGFDISGVKQVKYIHNRMLHDPKSGKIYTRYVGVGGRTLKKPVKYQASAEGEFPGTITKELYNSVYYEVRGVNSLAIGMGGPSAPYAKILEEGGVNGQGVYIAPRAPLKQTVEVFAPITRDEVNKQIKQSLLNIGADIT